MIKRKFEEHESSRERLCRLVDEGKVTLEDALLACIQMMSEDDCESVIRGLAEQALEQCDDERCAEEEDLPSDEEDVDDVEDEDVDEESDESTDEGCNRRKLENRIAKLERLLCGRKSVKTEGRLPDLDEVMQRMMEDLMSGDGMDYDEWIETLEAGAAGELDDTVEWYADEYDLPEDEVRHMLMRVAKQCLRDIENGDPTPFDESKKFNSRTSRISRTRA